MTASTNENENFIKAEEAKSQQIALRNELEVLKQTSEQNVVELAKSRKATERAENDLAQMTVKVSKLERYIVQKNGESVTLQKKFDVLKAEYTKTKQAQVGRHCCCIFQNPSRFQHHQFSLAQVLLIREVRKLRGEITAYKSASQSCQYKAFCRIISF